MATIGDVSDVPKLEYLGSPILPEQDSYQFGASWGVQSTEFAGGLPKQIVQTLNTPYTVTATYTGDNAKILWMNAFFTYYQGQKIQIQMLADDGDIEYYVAQVMNRPTPKTTGFNGSMQITYTVEPALDYDFLESQVTAGALIDPDAVPFIDAAVRALP